MIRIHNAFSRNWSWMTLCGPDAQDFLHRLTTVDVRGLETGRGAPGFFLNAQGKARAYFTLWHYGPEDYAFEFDPGQGGKWKAELLAAIDQYTFAEKIAVTDVGALECRWILADPSEEATLLEKLGAPGLTAGGTLAVDEEIRLCHHGDPAYGRPWLSAWGRPARLTQWLERILPPEQTPQVSEKELESWRILAMSPRIDAEVTPNTIPLEAGLVQAIAQGKGCYPGQEVIERIISLGSPARRLARIEGTGPCPSPGETLQNLAEPPAEVGQLTSVAQSPSDPDRFVALGFVRKIHAKEGLEVRLASTGARATLVQLAPYA